MEDNIPTDTLSVWCEVSTPMTGVQYSSVKVGIGGKLAQTPSVEGYNALRTLVTEQAMKSQVELNEHFSNALQSLTKENEELKGRLDKAREEYIKLKSGK